MQKKWRLYEKLKRRSDTLHVDDDTFAINSEDEEYYKWISLFYNLLIIIGFTNNLYVKTWSRREQRHLG